MVAPTLLHCSAHQALAGWQCTVCHAPLCPQCAVTKYVVPVSMVACGVCGELAEPLLRHKGDSKPLPNRILEAFIYPLTPAGLPMWLGLAGWLTLSGWAGLLGQLIGWCVALGTFFAVTRATASGHTHLELSDFQDPLASVVLPVATFGVITLPVWGLGLLAHFTGFWPLSVLAVVLALVWVPTAYLGAAAGTSLVHLLNPVRVLATTLSLKQDLALYVGGLLGVLVLGAIAAPVAAFCHAIPIPIVSGFLTQLALSAAPLVAARVAGAVLTLHSDAFGWLPEEAYEPVLPNVEPTGAWEQRPAQQGHKVREAIELPDEQTAAPTVGLHRMLAIEAAPGVSVEPQPLDVALLPSHEALSAQAIHDAIAKNDQTRALDGFRATGLLAAPSLSPEELLWLGKVAVSHIDYETAELAFRSAAERQGTAHAVGSARVMLARLLAERLGRPLDAEVLMKKVIAEQADTDAAAYATKWLAGRHP